MKYTSHFNTVRQKTTIWSFFTYVIMGLLFVFILNRSYENISHPLGEISYNVIIFHYFIVLVGLTFSNFLIDRIFNEIKWRKRTNRSFILVKSVLITIMVGVFIYLHVFCLWVLDIYNFHYLNNYSSAIQFLVRESYILLVLTFILSFLVNTLVFISRAIDTGFFFSMIFNRYQKPQKKKRVIMYLDLNDSTPIAEKLGNEKFLSFEQDFFKDIAIAIRETSGVICQYVGDEIMLNWSYRSAKQSHNCLKIFFMIKEVINLRKDFYIKKYGLVPEFKASIHCGKLLFGILGLNRIIAAYCGSVLNEGARIMGQCHNLEQQLLISGDAIKILGKPSEFEFTDFGNYDLKGVQHPIQILGVSCKAF